MADYPSKLRALFPNYKDGDWVLSFNSNTGYHLVWNRIELQPTPAQINAVTDAQVTAAEKEFRGEDGIAKLNPVIKALTTILSVRFGVAENVLLQELKTELKK